MHRNTNDQSEIPKTAGASHAGLVRATAFKAERACRAQRNALSLKHGLLRDKRQPPDGSSSRANCGKRKVERLPDMPSAMRSGSDLASGRGGAETDQPRSTHARKHMPALVSCSKRHRPI